MAGVKDGIQQEPDSNAVADDVQKTADGKGVNGGNNYLCNLELLCSVSAACVSDFHSASLTLCAIAAVDSFSEQIIEKAATCK